jgi:hypothetical protein
LGRRLNKRCGVFLKKVSGVRIISEVIFDDDLLN